MRRSEPSLVLLVGGGRTLESDVASANLPGLAQKQCLCGVYVEGPWWVAQDTR